MTGKKPGMTNKIDGKLQRSSDCGSNSFKIFLRLLFLKKQFKCIRALKKSALKRIQMEENCNQLVSTTVGIGETKKAFSSWLKTENYNQPTNVS